MDQEKLDRAYARLIVGSAEFMGFDLEEWIRYEFAELGVEEISEEVVKGLAAKLRHEANASALVADGASL